MKNLRTIDNDWEMQMLALVAALRERYTKSEAIEIALKVLGPHHVGKA